MTPSLVTTLLALMVAFGLETPTTSRAPMVVVLSVTKPASVTVYVHLLPTFQGNSAPLGRWHVLPGPSPLPPSLPFGAPGSDVPHPAMKARRRSASDRGQG